MRCPRCKKETLEIKEGQYYCSNCGYCETPIGYRRDSSTILMKRTDKRRGFK